MAKEMKGVQWDLLKPQRRAHLMRYPWHEYFNGSTWLLLHGEDFDVEPTEFQRYVLEIARENRFNVRTMLNEEGNGVWVQKKRPHSDRHKRIWKEWEQRWETQKQVGIDEWWKYPERLEDLRVRRQAAREERESGKGQRPRQPTQGEPYIPGWQKVLAQGGRSDVEDEA